MTAHAGSFHPLDLIRHKRDGRALSHAEIDGFVRAVVERTEDRPLISDAQIGSFLMAVLQRGLNTAELARLTLAMRTSGEVFDAKPLNTFTVDKHSTGGVGDKTSLLIAPIIAATGLAKPTPEGVPSICVPMISGRSLGHTGGTLDKLETIPGFDTQIPLARFPEILRRAGAVMVGQTPTLAPADRILYAMRDHTGTVESPHLITASIMSKKLAESLNALVLDVKTGSGAFMRRDADAELLAKLMVATGNAAGTRTVALLTRMDEPLGRFAGNWLEVQECADILAGRRHPMSADLIQLSNVLAGWMLFLAGRTSTPEKGAALASHTLDSGAALAAWRRVVAAQGGDSILFAKDSNPSAFHRPGAQKIFEAASDGLLASMDCTEVGWAVQRLGAGRTRPGDPVSAHAGIEVHAKIGQTLAKGQPIFTLFADTEEQLAEPMAMLRTACKIAPSMQSRRPLIGSIIQEGTRTA